MRKRYFRVLSLILVACMLMTGSGISVYAENDGDIIAIEDSGTYVEEDENRFDDTVNAITINFAQKIEQVKQKYPHGGHWYDSFEGSTTCVGFAFLMYYEFYGVSRTNGASYSSKSEVQKGDYLYYTGADAAEGGGHAVFVLDRNGDEITVVESNVYLDPYGIRWGTKKYLSAMATVGGRHAPAGTVFTDAPTPTPSNTFNFNVIGTSGRGNVSDTNATLYAKLATNVRSGLQVGIQIGTSSGNYNLKNYTEQMSQAGYNQLNSSGEVEIWYECNSELGVSLKKGTKYYYRFVAVYDNKTYYSSEHTFTTKGDSTPPKVKSAKITAYDKDGYTVTATASDDVGVAKIMFPTWTVGYSEEDIVWYQGSAVSNGTSTCKIKMSDFGNKEGKYTTDVRAYDAAGNVSDYYRLSITIDRTAPTISNAKVKRVDEKTVKVSCTVTDSSGVATVAFPTWTTTNGQDDLASDWWNTCAGQKSGDTWSFYVYDTDHNFEKNGYVTDVYAKDTYGNIAGPKSVYFDISNRYQPKTVTWKRHRYEIYDDLLTWEQAKEKCEEMGGHLATITSQEEQDVITNAIQSAVRDSFYLGAEIGKDTWITGEPIEYTNWAEGQPDNSKGVEDIYEIYNKSGGWNDSDRTRLYGRGFICEYEPEDAGDIPEDEIPESGIPEGLWVSGLNTDGYPYTGKAIKPEVKVYHHNKLLKKNADYSIAYKNNTNVYVGEDTTKQPQIVVTGKGNYTGKEYVYFDILPKNIGDADIQIDDIVKVYNGKNQATVPIIKWNGKKLTYNKTEAKSNYLVHFSNDGNCTEVGEYTITVEGRGNYIGTNSCKLNIVSNKLLSKATVSMTKSVPYNNGQAVVPTKLVLKYGKTTLTENVDYTVKYLNNTQIGTATVVLTGIGEYSGTKKVNFTVTGRNINKAKVEGLYAKDYTGEAITQNPVVTYNKELLVPEVDYLVSYQKNINAGTATVIFTGINKYTGTLKKTFKIKPYSILTNVTGSFKNDPNTISVQYTKAGSTPDVEVMFKDKVLVKNVDYTLSYKNNGAVNDGSNPTKLPTITIKGKGNFKDSVTKTFTITVGDLSKDGIRISASDKVWKNKKNAYKSTPTIYDVNGKKLVAGKDYSKQYVYRYNNKNGEVIGDNDIPEALSVIYVEVTGINNYAGSAIGTTYRIAKQNISSAKVSVASQTYTGKPITITKDDIKSVKIGKTTLLPEEYEIVPNSYTNNIKKGTASVKIRGLGNYGGEKKITFKITSKKLLFDWSWLFG